MKKKILVSGLLNIETTVSVKGFPINYYPIDYPFFGVNSNVSGVGCNLAKAFSVLGDDVELVSFLGDDEEGKRILNYLKNNNISSSNIHVSLKQTPVSVILFDKEGKRQVYCDLKDIQEQSISPDTMSGKTDNIDIAVLCNINFNRELIKAFRKDNILTATDVHVLADINDEYNRDFMDNSDILFLSDECLPCPPEEFIKQIHDKYHNRIIVIGMGAKGALLYDDNNNKITAVPAYCTGNVVNTVGAGDALFSSFIHFYAKGYSAEDSLRRAVIFAGIKIGYNGAALGFADESEIVRIFRNL